MQSNAINEKNYKIVLEKMFGNLEYILKFVLEGINQIDASVNFDHFLLW